MFYQKLIIIELLVENNFSGEASIIFIFCLWAIRSFIVNKLAERILGKSKNDIPKLVPQ